MRELVQRKFFTKTTFRFSESKLFCKVSKYGNGDEFDIPFEQINGDKYSITKQSDVTLFIALSFGVLVFFMAPIAYSANNTYLYLFILIMLVIIGFLIFSCSRSETSFGK